MSSLAGQALVNSLSRHSRHGRGLQLILSPPAAACGIVMGRGCEDSSWINGLNIGKYISCETLKNHQMAYFFEGNEE